MTISDAWTMWAWSVYVAAGPGSPNVKPTKATGQFRLVRQTDPATGQISYVLDPNTLVMPPCWSATAPQRTTFWPVGNVAVPPLPVTPLSPWQSAHDGDWQTAEDHLRQCILNNPDIHRLEGSIYVAGKPEHVVLIRADNATSEGTPVLAVHVIPSGVSVRQDGTGHGDGGPPH